MKVFSTGFAIGLMEARVATPYPLAIGQVGLPALENSFALQKIFGAHFVAWRKVADSRSGVEHR